MAKISCWKKFQKILKIFVKKTFSKIFFKSKRSGEKSFQFKKFLEDYFLIPNKIFLNVNITTFLISETHEISIFQIA